MSINVYIYNSTKLVLLLGLHYQDAVLYLFRTLDLNTFSDLVTELHIFSSSLSSLFHSVYDPDRVRNSLEE